MWKTFTIMVAFALSGCASVSIGDNSDPRIADYISRLKPSFANIERISVGISSEVAGNVAGSRGNSNCHVVVDKGYIEKGASDVELAFVLAHEMAHCDADHSGARRMFVDPARFREQELMADKMALDATRKAGLGDISVLTADELPFFLKDSYRESNTHPAGRARLNSMRGISSDGLGLFVQDGRLVIGRSLQ